MESGNLGNSHPTILAFAGSTREGSFNKKILTVAVDAAKAAGVQVTVIDLKDYPLPLYDGDLESEKGLPENAKKLKKLFLEHEGLLLACPEYNSSISGVLKNTIDWLSRKETDDEENLIVFKKKVAALISASPSALGGLRGLVHVRTILGNIGVLVIPEQKTIPKADKAIDENGQLTSEIQVKGIQRVSKKLVEVLMKLKS